MPFSRLRTGYNGGANIRTRPKGLDATIPVEGLVVIGRNRDLTDQDKRRLLHLNNTRDVKLITYDGLLEKLEILIQNLESLE